MLIQSSLQDSLGRKSDFVLRRTISAEDDGVIVLNFVLMSTTLGMHTRSFMEGVALTLSIFMVEFQLDTHFTLERGW